MTALLYLWNLSANGWANSFYSAAAQAGASNWTAMLFGSSDAANAITVDKTPASLWLMDISVRIFGLNPWSVLVPQALEGVAAVALLYAAVRRVSGPGAALLAGAIMALTPVAALMFRFNNPDALLVLCPGRGRLLHAACVRKGQQPLVVGRGGCRGRLRLSGQDAAGIPGAAGIHRGVPGGGESPVGSAAARCGDVWSRRSSSRQGGICCSSRCGRPNARPYIGGSQHDSIIELALGYNGFGRLTGDEPGGLGNMNFDVGWARLFGHGMGADIAWLLPAAVVCLGAIVVLTRRAARTDPTRAAAIIWGGWLLVTAVVFSFMNGIVHPYYTVALAPAIAALVGIGATLLWQNRFTLPAATALSGIVLVSSDPGMRAVGAGPDAGCPGSGHRRRRGSRARRRCCWWSAGCPHRLRVRWPAWRRWCPWRRLPRTPLRPPRPHTAGRYLRRARQVMVQRRWGPAAC